MHEIPLLKQILINFQYLQMDFIGLSLDTIGIARFFYYCLLAVIIMFVLFLTGNMVRNIVVGHTSRYGFFANFALGYIIVGTLIGLLGVVSLLTVQILFSCLLLITIVSLYMNKNMLRSISIKAVVKKLSWKKLDGITISILLFVFIAFLRLMTLEVTEDAYHTDFPKLYLQTHTTVHENKDPLHAIPYPQLAEMIYVIPVALGNKEAVRFIHFSFYLLIIGLLFTITKKSSSSFAKFAPLLFVTAPVVIRYSSTQYVDFFMVFCFMVAVLLLRKGMSTREAILAGIILGGSFATKVWTVVYLPVFFFYIFLINKNSIKEEVSALLVPFGISSVLVPFMWYVRAFIITGNPLFPFFGKFTYLETDQAVIPASSYYFGFNWNMFSPRNMGVLSPLFFLAVLAMILYWKKVKNMLMKYPLSLFFVILAAEQLVVRIDLGRYLLAWYSLAIICASAGLVVAMKQRIFRYVFMAIYVCLFSYYFITTLLVLPYGLGWADKNKYLTRVLYRDNASYYDFDRRFDKWISSEDFVATYGIYGYYYADFAYLDVNFIFSQDKRSFKLLKERGATKLLIKGGDMAWFCKRLSLIDCPENVRKPLASYPSGVRKYNFYTLYAL